MPSSYLYLRKPTYLGSIIMLVAISVLVDGKINHLLRMRRKLPEKDEVLIVGEVGRAT